MRGFDPAGRVAVVTGGARGIGRAIATALRDAGALVAIGDVDDRLAAATAAEVGVRGGRLDVAAPDSVTRFADEVEADLGPITVWVNNAGIMPIGPVLDQEDPNSPTGASESRRCCRPSRTPNSSREPPRDG